MRKIFQRATACLPLLVLACSFNVSAQSLTTEDIKTQIIKEWERSKVYTNEYLNTMPADKYGFKPVDSIRSFAQQMLHLAQANFFLMMNATDQMPPAFAKSDLEHRATAQNKDSVVYYTNASYDYCINAVKATPLNKWGEKKKVMMFEETRLALILKTLEHQTHHRGQTTIYIRLQGIKPPQEKLF